MRFLHSTAFLVVVSFVLLSTLPGCRSAPKLHPIGPVEEALPAIYDAYAVREPASSWLSKIKDLKTQPKVVPTEADANRPELHVQSWNYQGTHRLHVKPSDLPASRQTLGEHIRNEKLARVESHFLNYHLVNDDSVPHVFRFDERDHAFIVFPKYIMVIPDRELTQQQVKDARITRLPPGTRIRIDNDKLYAFE